MIFKSNTRRLFNVGKIANVTQTTARAITVTFALGRSNE